MTRDDDQVLALGHETIEADVCIWLVKIFNNAVLGFDSEDVLDRSATQIEIYQVGLKPRIPAQCRGYVRRDERLADVGRCRSNAHHPPAALTVESHQL